jgi:hypothetical protein|tara:strand:- start:45 stop:320 length:276 start_codon:yes stop_codon:yes gene_type:complete
MMSGKFFGVASEAFHAACANGLNAACAYIVLACGTGKDSRSTIWSCDAISRHTSISRRRAKAARNVLLEFKLVSQTNKSISEVRTEKKTTH